MKRLFFVAIVSLISFSGYTQSIDSLLSSGIEKIEKEDLPGAILDLTAAIEKDSSEADAYFYRAVAYFELYKLEESLIDLDACQRLNPDVSTIYWLRGSVRNMLGLAKYAILDLDHAIEMDSNSIQAYLERCVTRFKLGDKEGACHDLATAKLLGAEITSFWKKRLKVVKCD